jgi:hypothetical protein
MAQPRLEYERYTNENGEWHALVLVRDDGPAENRVTRVFQSPVADSAVAAAWGPAIAKATAGVSDPGAAECRHAYGATQVTPAGPFTTCSKCGHRINL